MLPENMFQTCTSLLAQASVDRTWIDALLAIRTDKLVIVLIFGTGLVSAAGYAISQILRAANGSPDDSEDLQSQIAELQQRVKKLESSVNCQSSEQIYS